MVWKVELSELAQKNLEALDLPLARRVVSFLYERLALLDNPRSLGEPLKGARLGQLWRWRVGDLRLIASIEDEKLLVVVVRVGHRREVYRWGR